MVYVFHIKWKHTYTEGGGEHCTEENIWTHKRGSDKTLEEAACLLVLKYYSQCDEPQQNEMSENIISVTAEISEDRALNNTAVTGTPT